MMHRGPQTPPPVRPRSASELGGARTQSSNLVGSPDGSWLAGRLRPGHTVRLAAAAPSPLVAQLNEALASGTRSLFGRQIHSVEHFFEALDHDSRGLLRRDEIVWGFLRLDVEASQHDVTRFVQQLDSDSNGHIGLMELAHGLGEQLPQVHPKMLPGMQEATEQKDGGPAAAAAQPTPPTPAGASRELRPLHEWTAADVDDTVEGTESVLGRLVDLEELHKSKSPRELLVRPPPRFVHEVACLIKRATGFPQTMGTDWPDPRDAKIDLLQHICDSVASSLHIESVEFDPANVLKGKEVPQTLRLLQLLAVAAAREGKSGDGADGLGASHDRGKEEDLMANSDDLEVLTAALQASSGGVPWPHVRLLVRGGGGDGKTSTVNSMAGREFDSQAASTVGAGMLDMELRCDELCAGAQGSPLQPYTGRDEEYVLALVEHRARLEGAGTTESMLDAPVWGETPPRARGQPDDEAPEGVDASAGTAGAPTSPAPSNSGARASGSALGELSGRPDGAEAPDGTGATGVAARSLQRGAKVRQPPAPGDLIVKFRAVQGRAANAERRLTIKVQDTGGQPVFAQLIERLMSPGGTVHMLVFSIPKLHDTFEECVGRLAEHLRAIAAFAPGAPLILVGTRKDSLQADLTGLADRLLRDLRERCPSAISGLVTHGNAEAGEGVCFFAVENSKGFSTDQAIRDLVGAVEKAAMGLRSIKQRVPLAWLQVYDRLRQEADGGRRHAQLDEVKLIAEGCGMPHFGLTMDQELVAMLTFFHSFNAVLWWDVPELRSLVILDPQWIIDAASCFIREFKLPDHTTGYARMRDIDADAIRQDKDSWTALTEGKGILRSGLLDIFWREADFADHRSELLAVMCRFGLLVPVPAKKGVTEYIVPALLRSSSQPPANWPQPSADAAQLRLHFSLCDGDETTAILSTSELQSGFVPVSTFHSLCSLALGCSKQTSTDEYAVYLDMAFVSFSKERVILSYRPAEGSIIVQLMSKGSDCSAGNVVDYIRGFLAENLSVYPNLRARLLVQYPGDDRMWVDLVSLMDTPAGTIQKRLRGTSVMVDKFRNALVNYFTKECDFYFVEADKLRSASQKEFPDMKLKSLQEMRRTHPDWLVKRTISLKEACLGAYRHDHLAVSHRWNSKEHPDIDPYHPDMTGKQLQKVQEFLSTDAGSRMKYVFYDFVSCPQGNRTAEEKAEFTTMLANMNMVYIGCSVLVLLDYDYTGRFWTQFESWLSMVKATPNGLIQDPGTPRCFIEVIYGTPEAYKVALKSSFGDCRARTAHGLLGAPAIRVTNASDKAMQLPKILELDTLTRHLLVAAGASPSAADPGRPQQPAQDGDDLKTYLRDLEVADIEGAAAALREAGVKSAARFQQLCPDDWAELAELLREAGVKLGDRAAMRDAVNMSFKSR